MESPWEKCEESHVRLLREAETTLALIVEIAAKHIVNSPRTALLWVSDAAERTLESFSQVKEALK